ncbi:MAG: hypothetical protein KFF72_20755 [Arthrospira sp. SH-MAG29]|nr:hypothetical protein [Arthrospira sp. SH-MAG29]MBS0018746.1 hypothetical protein [Arthrospira sp. SH-MAG29]
MGEFGRVIVYQKGDRGAYISIKSPIIAQKFPDTTTKSLLRLVVAS